MVLWTAMGALGRQHFLTHWGRVAHIYDSKSTIIGSANGLSPGWRQAIISTNAGLLSIGLLGTNFSEIWIEIHILSFKKMHLKLSSAKWRPFCLGLNVLNVFGIHLTIMMMRQDWFTSLQWRHNGWDGVLNHLPHYCLLNRLFRHRSKKTSKLSVTGLCEGNSPVTGEFPTQRASNVKNVSIWWRYHVMIHDFVVWLICDDLPMPSWWLQMARCQTGTGPSATSMLPQLWL